MAGTLSVEAVCKTDAFKRIKDHLQKHAESPEMFSRTLALWVQYMNMLDILHKGRAHWKLGTSSKGYPGNAALPGSLGA